MAFDEGRSSDAVPVAAEQVTVTYQPERDGEPDRIVHAARDWHPDLRST